MAMNCRECKSVDYYPAMNLSYRFYKVALIFIWYACNLDVLTIIYSFFFNSVCFCLKGNEQLFM